MPWGYVAQFIMACSCSPLSHANFTLSLSPGDEAKESLMQSAGSYSAPFDDHDNKFPTHGAISEIKQGLWLVSLLRYMVSISGDSITMANDPVRSLAPVVLVSSIHWWFQEQKVLEALSYKGERVMGHPIYLGDYLINTPLKEPDRTSKKTDLPEPAPSSQVNKNERAASIPLLQDTHSLKRNRDGKGHEQRIQHNCGKICPACNHNLCHCNNCKAREKRKRVRKPPLENTTKKTRQHRVFPATVVTNILRWHAQRAVDLVPPLPIRYQGDISQYQLSHTLPIQPETVIENAMPAAILSGSRIIMTSGESSNEARHVQILSGHYYSGVFIEDLLLSQGASHNHLYCLALGNTLITLAYGKITLWREVNHSWVPRVVSKKLRSYNQLIAINSNTAIAININTDHQITLLTAGDENLHSVDLPQINRLKLITIKTISDSSFVAVYGDWHQRTEKVILWKYSDNQWISYELAKLWYWQEKQKTTGVHCGILEYNNNQYVSWCSDSTIQLWTTLKNGEAESEVIINLHLGYQYRIINVLSFGRDMLITIQQDMDHRCHTKVWQQQEGQWNSITLTHSSPYTSARAHGDNQFILCSGSPTTIWTYDSNSWQPTTLPSLRDCREVFSLKDGRFISQEYNGLIRLWNYSFISEHWDYLILSALSPDKIIKLYEISGQWLITVHSYKKEGREIITTKIWSLLPAFSTQTVKLKRIESQNHVIYQPSE